MRMQEPEPGRQSEQEWQTSREYDGYRADEPGSYGSEQQQKIYPAQAQGVYSKAFLIFSVVLSSIGFALTILGIVGSSLVLKYADGQPPLLIGGIMGLVSSILVMLICIAIFVMAVVSLALRGRIRRGSRWNRARISF